MALVVVLVLVNFLGFEHAMKGGIGTYGVQVGNVQVAGIVAVNACGNVIDYKTQEILAGVNIDKNVFRLVKLFRSNGST